MRQIIFRRFAPIAAFSLLVVATAESQDITLRMADAFPPGHENAVIVSKSFIDAVESESNGKIKIKHFPGGQLVKANTMLDGARTRVTDISVAVLAYSSDRMPLVSVADLPGQYEDLVLAQKALSRLIFTDLLEREFHGNGVQPLLAFMVPPSYLITASDKRIAKPEDFKGLKLRAAGASVAIGLAAIGAVPARLASTDVYIALQRGTIDGAIQAPASAKGNRLHEVAKGMVTNISFGSVSAAFLINAQVWAGLPKESQEVLLRAGAKTAAQVAERFNKLTETSIKEMRDVGVVAYEVPPETKKFVEEGLATVAKHWIEQMESRKLPGKAIHEAFNRYLQEEARNK